MIIKYFYLFILVLFDLILPQVIINSFCFFFFSVLRIRIRDPMLFWLLDPDLGSWISFFSRFLISDPGYNPFLEQFLSLVNRLKCFSVPNLFSILWNLWIHKRHPMATIFFLSSFLLLLDPGSMIGDRLRKKSGYGKNNTDPLHCFLLCVSGQSVRVSYFRWGRKWTRSFGPCKGHFLLLWFNMVIWWQLSVDHRLFARVRDW